MNRAKILEAYISITEASLAVMEKAAIHAHESAISDETKSQDKYDTQSIELSYLAGAQSKRAADLKESLRKLNLLREMIDEKPQHIVVGSLVELKNLANNSKPIYMILPIEGGLKVEVDGREISSLLATGPLAEELYGRKEAEEFEVEINNRVFQFRIESLF